MNLYYHKMFFALILSVCVYVYICMHLPGPVLSRYSLPTVITQIPALPLCLSWASFCHSFPGKEQPSDSMASGESVKQEGRTECRQICTRASQKLPRPRHNLADIAVFHLPDPMLSCTLHHIESSPEPHSILKPVLTGQRYFKPWGVTPDRLRSVLQVRQKGETISLCILFTKRAFSQVYSLYQTSSHSWRPASLQGGQPRGRKYLHTRLSSWRHKLNRVFCAVKRKIPQEAAEVETDFPIQTAFQRRPLHLSLYLHRTSASIAKHGMFGCASVIP